MSMRDKLAILCVQKLMSWLKGLALGVVSFPAIWWFYLWGPTTPWKMRDAQPWWRQRLLAHTCKPFSLKSSTKKRHRGKKMPPSDLATLNLRWCDGKRILFYCCQCQMSQWGGWSFGLIRLFSSSLLSQASAPTRCNFTDRQISERSVRVGASLTPEQGVQVFKFVVSPTAVHEYLIY